MALTDVKVRTEQTADKGYKLTDGEGMHLYVHSTGSKYWRLQYRFDGKQKTLALGIYPEISLADSRQRRDESKCQIANNINPSEQKKLEKIEGKSAVDNTFQAVTLKWPEYKKPNWSKDYAEDLIESFENDIFPSLGKRPIAE